MRLIDADALKEFVKITHKEINSVGAYGRVVGSAVIGLLNDIDAQPTIEERKRGEWIGKYPVTSVCSECGFLINDSKVRVFVFCPSCGARMEVTNATD